MALVKGTNCGFVTVAPTADPSGTATTNDTYAHALKDTSPVGRYRVVEIGWWCDAATEAANYDIGIYSHDAGNDRPNVLIGSALNNAKGTGTGWLKISGLSIPLVASTIYWIGMQLDNTATASKWDYAAAGGEKYDSKNAQTALPATWGVSDGASAYLVSVYALIVKIGGGFSGGQPWIFMKDMWEKHNKLWTPKLLLPKEGYSY